MVAQLEKLLSALAASDPELLQADELADAVVDMHDEIADLQIPQVRQERARQVAALGPPAFLVEDVGFGVHLQAGIDKAEAARERADGHEHGGGMRVFRQLHRQRDNLVLLQNLDRALGATGALGHEHHGVATLPRLADLDDPVVHATVELHGRHAPHVTHLSRPRLPRASSSISSSKRRALSSRGISSLEARRTHAPAAAPVIAGAARGRIGRSWSRAPSRTARRRVAHLFVLRHDQPHRLRGREELQERH